MFENVLLSVMVNAPAPPWFTVQLYVEPPPTNVFAVAAVILIVPVPVPAVVVNPVGTALFHAVVVAAEHAIVPPLNVMFFVPVAVTKVVVGVSVYPAKSKVPDVSVTVGAIIAAARVVVPVLLTSNDATVLPLPLRLPVPRITIINEVNVPLLFNVKLFKFSVVVGTVYVVLVKSSLLNQLPEVRDTTLAPVPVIVKLGALVDEPPELKANRSVFATSAAVLKPPPVVVQVKPVAVPIDNTTVAAVGCTNTILPVPNAIERVFELLELNIPVVRVYPFIFNAPWVSVVVAVEVVDILPCKVVVPV
jgi:hypothetical protein